MVEILISGELAIPLKYMNTTVERTHKKDVENEINLYLEFLKSLNSEFFASLGN
jgi:putative aminopeptidase FrvX